MPVDQNPALNIVKDGGAAAGRPTSAGELINYTITVAEHRQPDADRRDGDRSVRECGLDRARRRRGRRQRRLLDVGETWSYTAAHTVTQAEIDSNGGGDGDLDNTATADSNETGPDTDDATVPVAQNPALNIVKTASAGGSRPTRRAS